jgi:hypothetical protein
MGTAGVAVSSGASSFSWTGWQALNRIQKEQITCYALASFLILICSRSFACSASSFAIDYLSW